MGAFSALFFIALAQLCGIVYGCGEGSPSPSFKTVYSVLATIDVNNYKKIDCSADNFCHIDWYKDGVPFPFGWNDGQLEDMGVSLDENNQTLVLRKAEMMAKGNYTCVVSNGQGSISRYLLLDIHGNDWVHEPILAFDNQCHDKCLCNDKWVNIGDNATFTCKVFAGPRLHSTWGGWYYVEKESSSEETTSEDVQQADTRQLPYTVFEAPERTFDGKLQVITLNIFNVTEPALGTYILSISNGIEPALEHRVTLALQEQGEERRLPLEERRGALWERMKNNRAFDNRTTV